MSRVRATDQFKALRGTVQRRRRRSVRPGVSVLEDRMMLAAYTVISSADTNTGNAVGTSAREKNPPLLGDSGLDGALRGDGRGRPLSRADPYWVEPPP